MMSPDMGARMQSYMQASTKQALILTNPGSIIYKVSGFESVKFAFASKIRVNSEESIQVLFLETDGVTKSLHEPFLQEPTLVQNLHMYECSKW